MRRFIRLTVPALLLAAALASGLGCTGASEEASSPTPRATTATAAPSPVAAPAARSAPAATATSAPSPTTTTHSLTIVVTGGGRTSPLPGTYTYVDGESVTVTATPDEGYAVASWGGDCSTAGTATTCTLTMDADKTVTATFTALPATRCATPTAADCIRAVYRGAPGDYAQVSEIPPDVLLTADTGGHYYVERGQQYTVVTAARLPEGWTRFYLQRDPGPTFGTPSPVSASQLIKPVGTTYTFTVSEDDNAPARFTFELTAAKPHPVRPTHKPILGTVVARTVFQSPKFTYNRFDTTGAATAAGNYTFLMPDPNNAGSTTAVTTSEQLRTESTLLRVNVTDADGVSLGGFYDSVAVGDLLEWRRTDDCWARYRVASVPGSPPRASTRQFGVRSFTDAYAGCSAAVTVDGERQIDWSPPAISSRTLTSPVRHGLFHLIPTSWTGRSATPVFPTVPDRVAAIRDLACCNGPHPWWREADVPEGWTLAGVTWGGATDPTYGYSAWYRNEHGDPGVEILVAYWAGEQYPWPFPVWADRALVREPRIIDGRHALVEYSPAGPKHQPRRLPQVYIFDEETRMLYFVIAWDPRLAGSDPRPTIEIARSLAREPNASSP